MFNQNDNIKFIIYFLKFKIEPTGFDADYPPGQLIYDVFSHQSFVTISIEFICDLNAQWQLQDSGIGFGPKPINTTFISVSTTSSQVLNF